MTSPTDSLVTALRAALDAVDVVVCIRGLPEMCPCCRARASAEGRASISALAAAVRGWMRGWMRRQMPEREAGVWDSVQGYNAALADVARRLGL